MPTMRRPILPCLAAAALVAATLAVWHWRFVAVPGVLPETRLAAPLVGWKSKPHQQHQVIEDGNIPVLRLQRNRLGEKTPAVQIWLGPMEGVRFIHVRCESRWTDVELGPEAYHHARFAVSMKDRNGKISHPPDSMIFVGTGTRDWHKSEAILELTSDMVDTNFAIAMLGKSGALEVRHLTLTAVHQREWVPFAGTMIILGWIAFCASLIRSHRSSPAWWRATAAAAVIIAFSWVTVFPQTKGLLRPLLGQFSIGELAAVPPEDSHVQLPRPSPPVSPQPAPGFEPSPAITPAPPVPPPANPDQPKPPPEVASHHPETESPAEARHPGKVHRLGRGFDKHIRVAHLAMFTVFTLAVLLITGSRSQFHLPLALAFLSEFIPGLTGDPLNREDWWDLLQNLGGIGMALLLWSMAHRWRKHRAKRADSTA
jgi:hypothetical protein